MSSPDGALLDPLLAALGNERYEVRSGALDAIGQRGQAAVSLLHHILPRVEDPAWQVRGAAVRALAALGFQAHSVHQAYLSRLLHDPHLWVRRAALAGIAAALASPAAQFEAPLLEVLAGPSPALPRVRALQALGHLRLFSEPVLQALLKAVTDTSWEVRAQALRVLGETPREAPRARRAATLALGDADPSVREAACEALRQLSPLGDAEAEALGRLVADPEPPVRVACARALGQCSSLVHRQALRGLMRDPDERVREAVVLALGGGGLEPLSQWKDFLEDPSALVRQAAASFLADVEDAGAGDTSLAPLAGALLGLGSVSARDAAARLVADDEPMGLPYLFEGLRHRRARIRHRAARALGFFGLESAVAARGVPLLGAALRDPSEWVRYAATESLGRVGLPALPTYPELLRRAFERTPWVPAQARQVVRVLRAALPANWVVLEPQETAEHLFTRCIEDPLLHSRLPKEVLIALCLHRERWHHQFCRPPPPPGPSDVPTVREAAERAARAAVAHGASRRRARPSDAPRDRAREFAWLLGRLHALAMPSFSNASRNAGAASPDGAPAPGGEGSAG